MANQESEIEKLDQLGNYLMSEFCLTQKEATLAIFAAYYHREGSVCPTIDEIKSRAESIAVIVCN